MGAYKPRMLGLTGRLADGWIPSQGYAPPETIPEMQHRIDRAAEEAGRDPQDVRRAYNFSEATAEELTHFAVELGLDTFTYWPQDDPLAQLERFAEEIVPGVREAVAATR